MRWVAVASLALVLAGALAWWGASGSHGRRAAADREAEDAAVPAAGEKPGPEEAEAPGFVAYLKDAEGRPVADAIVAGAVQGFGRNPWQYRSAGEQRSDAEGRFAFAARDDDYAILLWVRHPRFAAQQAGFLLGLREPPVIVLQPGAPVSVEVLTPDHQPAAGAKVAVQLTYQGSAGLDLDFEATTGADGRASLFAWPECHGTIRVDHPPFAPATDGFDLVGSAPVTRTIVLSAGGGIAGRVLGPDRAPVVGATVTVNTRTTTSGPDGAYELPGLAPGEVWPTASKDGYGPGYFGETVGWGQPVPVPVHDGRTSEGIDLVLGHPFRVVGRVLDERERPLAGVVVHAYVSSSYGSVRDATTGEDGRFELGPCTLRRLPAKVELQFDPEPGRAVEPLHRTVETRVEVLDLGDLQATREAVVRGVVQPAPGTELPLRVWIRAGSRQRPVRGGRFEIHVPPGAVELSASGWDDDAGEYQAPAQSFTVGAGEAREGVTLQLRPVLKIAGRVVDEFGDPRVQVLLAAVPARATPPYLNAQHPFYSTDDKGNYSIGVAADEEYRVGIVDSQPESFTFQEDPPPRTARPGGGAVDFIVPRGVKGGVVLGRVVSRRDGRPVSDFTVVTMRYVLFVPQHSDWSYCEDPDGRFEVVASPPGRYALSIDADGFASYRTDAFNVAAGDRTDLGEIRLGDGGRIVGTLEDAAGHPVPYAQVHILSAKLEAKWQPPFTDLDGAFEHDTVSPGVYTIFAVSPRHPLLIRQGVRVGEGERVVLDLAFPEASPLHILVRDPQSVPLAGVKLVYSFPAMAPFTSEQVGNYEPEGYGANESDASGEIRKPQLPAGPVTIRLVKDGYEMVQRQVELVAGEENRVEITMRPAR